MKDMGSKYKYKVNGEMLKTLMEWYPEEVKAYGVRIGVEKRFDGEEYKYCKICEVYFTKNTDSLRICPFCHRPIRRLRNSKSKNARWIDPERYGLEVS